MRTEGLTKRYGGVAALDRLDLEVAQGEVVGYLGPNGAGKTTTIRLLLGLINPTAGRGEIFGLDCHRQPVETHRRLAFVPGEADLWPSLTGAETLELLGRVQGRVDEAYRDELVARFDLDPAKKVRAYSKGNRQKVILIAALMTRADLLVLDEPTSGLDPLMLAMVATAVMFLAAGALTSQLAATRRQAASYAAAFLGVSYAVRMIADAGLGLHGLIWASPLGWVEELRPLTAPHPLALLPIAAFTAVLAAAAVHLAGTRDAGASILPDRDTSRPHLRLLTGPTGLALRLVRPAVVSWWTAIAVSGLLFGLIAKSAGGTISGSSARQVLAKLGALGTGAAAVLGVCFLTLAVLIAFAAAGQITAARAEEAGGRLDHLLVRPVSRSRWLGGRLLIAVAVLLAAGVLAGVLAWLGAASQHAGVGFTTMVEAGVNLVPPAITILGIGVLAFGIRPRATPIVVYVVLGWSLFAVLIGGIGAISHWVLDTSVFHQMASAPAVPPHWEANGVMVAIGFASALIGGIAFSRRDLQGQ